MNIFSQFISSLISAWVKVEKIQIPEVIQQQVKHEVPLVYVLERRSLSDWAVLRKQAKAFKSVIKLDQNFHIYVHGRRDWIERGFDDDKKTHYYKVYFKSEE